MAGWLDILFPAHCASCKKPGNWWCEPCASRVILDRKIIHFKDSPLAGVVAGCHFQGTVPAAIKALKYRHTRAIATGLAQYLEPLLQLIPVHNPALVPIPLHPTRLKKRGFNQATLLAKAVSCQTGLPVIEELHRIRNTTTQTELHRSERFANVADAFKWNGKRPPSNIILVDDVLTTGATMIAAAKACNAAGTQSVWGITVARRD